MKANAEAKMTKATQKQTRRGDAASKHTRPNEPFKGGKNELSGIGTFIPCSMNIDIHVYVTLAYTARSTTY